MAKYVAIGKYRFNLDSIAYVTSEITDAGTKYVLIYFPTSTEPFLRLNGEDGELLLNALQARSAHDFVPEHMGIASIPSPWG